MLHRGLKFRLITLLIGITLGASASALAQNSVERMVTLPSGKKLHVLATGRAKGDGGKTEAAMIRYRSNKRHTDKTGLAEEADDLWDLFKIDAETSGLKTAVLSAEIKSDKPNGGTHYVYFTLDKNASGAWICRNDQTVGSGTPAKKAYKDGFRLLREGRYKEALASYSKAIRLNPGYTQSYVDRAAVYINLKQLNKALADCNKAISLVPTHAGAYCNRGIVRSKMGNYTEAIADFDSAIRLNPSFGLSYGKRGIAYVKLGQYNRAVEDLNKAINLKADLGEVFHYRAEALEKIAKSDRKRSAKLGYKPAAGKAL